MAGRAQCRKLPVVGQVWLTLSVDLEVPKPGRVVAEVVEHLTECCTEARQEDRTQGRGSEEQAAEFRVASLHERDGHPCHMEPIENDERCSVVGGGSVRGWWAG